MYKDLIEFLKTEECFIEAEGQMPKISGFIEKYNSDFGEDLTVRDDGIILLQDGADKWGLELRLYVRSCPPSEIKELGFKQNNAYRNDFSYRLNNKDIVNYLFDMGFRIGLNRV